MKAKKRPSNQKGQFVIEAVLLMVISLMLFLGLMKSFKDKQILENILVKPWDKIAGMIENGAWGSAQNTRSKHPHNPDAVSTLKQD